MPELFETVLALSLLGFCITALLLCLKPITARKLPAQWQYGVWIAVLFSMLVPVYKLIPAREVDKLMIVPKNELVQQEAAELEEAVRIDAVGATPVLHKEISLTQGRSIRLIDLLAYVWLSGMCIYLLVVVCSYAAYVSRKRKNAVVITKNAALDAAKRELEIKRHIKIRMSGDFESPMLVGVMSPVIYIPSREIPHENMRMVLLHELTHYKRKDLLIKWLCLFVNAVHWFNPLTYLLCANISEACEISCDMSVTKNMSDAEQKIYMKTILDLVE